MIAGRFEEVLARATAAAARGKHHQAVRILPVTKTVGVAETNLCLAVQRGLGLPAIIGESYIGDYLKKVEFLEGEFEAHFIGPLQDSAVSKVVRLFNVIHSVHSVELLRKVAKEAAKIKKNIKLFIQVNISSDSAKHGIGAFEVQDVLRTATEIGVEISGLMAITKDYEAPDEARPDFVRLRELRDSVLPGRELSMGMSRDYEVAAEEGATIVRVGSALFAA